MKDVEQMKTINEGIMQNKIVNNAVCGKIEKLEDLMTDHKTQMDKMENNLMVTMNKISNIQERIAENESSYGQIIRTFKTENMSNKKSHI
jgi:hypothetical protein